MACPLDKGSLPGGLFFRDGLFETSGVAFYPGAWPYQWAMAVSMGGVVYKFQKGDGVALEIPKEKVAKCYKISGVTNSMHIAGAVTQRWYESGGRRPR